MKTKLTELLAVYEEERRLCANTGDAYGEARAEGKLLALEVLAELYEMDGLY